MRNPLPLTKLLLMLAVAVVVILLLNEPSQLGYVLQAIAKQSADLEWIGAFSPFNWVNDPVPLLDGWNLPGFALVWGCSAVCVAAAALVLRRRDIT